MFITATIYKNPLDEKKVRALCEAQVDALRVKFAHDTTEVILDVLRRVNGIISTIDTKTAIHVDLPEAKFRFGAFLETLLPVDSDKLYTLRSADYSESLDEFIPVRAKDLPRFFAVGDRILTGDGQLAFTVEAVGEEDITVRFESSGDLHQNTGMFSPRIAKHMDHLSPVLESIPWFEGIFPAFISLSFTGSAEQIRIVREQIASHYGDRWQPQIMAKIESPEGLDNLEEIVQEADMVVVARGDLALFGNPHTCILEQKRICQLSNTYQTPVIVATQILESLCTKPLPNRSELADLTNIILDGANGVWLSKETCFHDTPEDVISFIRAMHMDLQAHLAK